MRLLSFFLRIAVFSLMVLYAGGSIVWAQESAAEEQFQYARRLMEDGLTDLAITQFQEFIRLYSDSPRVPEAQFQIGLLLQQIGDWDKSSAMFRQLMIQYPEFTRCDEALFQTARNHMELQELERAATILERFSLFYPKSVLVPRSYLEAGLLRLRQNQKGKAEEDWLRLIQEHSQSVLVHQARFQLARLYFHQHRFHAAQNQIDRILDSSPSGDFLADVRLLKAKILTEQYQLEQAEQLYQQIFHAQLSPAAFRRVKFSYAEYLNRIGHPERAIQEIEPLLARPFTGSIQDSIIQIWVISQWRAENDQAVMDAVHQFQDTIQDSSFRISLLEYGIRSALRSNAHETAVALLKKRLSFEKVDRSDNPLVKKFHLALLRQYRRLHRTADALQHGEMILRWDWNDSQFVDRVRYEVAQIYQKALNQPRQALFYYELILAPNHKSQLADESAFEMANCYASLQDHQQAFRIFQNFPRTFPASPLLDQVYKKNTWYRYYRSDNPTRAWTRSSVLLTTLLLEGKRKEAVFTFMKQMFHEMRDYKTVIQLGRLLLGRHLFPTQKDEFYRVLGEAFYREAFRQGEPPPESTQLDSARIYLLQYITETSDNAGRLRAALLIHDIDQRKSDLSTSNFLQEYDFLTKLISRFSGDRGVRYPRFQLARLLDNYGRRAARDSVRSAIAIYSQILADSSVSLSSPPENDRISSPLSPHSSLPEQSLYYRLQAQLWLGDTLSAVRDMQLYHSRYPRGRFILPVLKELGQIAVQRKEWEPAERIYSEMVNTFYYSSFCDSAAILLAQVKIKREEYSEAAEILQPYQNMKTASYLLGLSYQKMGDDLHARQVYTDYLRLFPRGKHVSDIYLHLTEMADRHHQPAEAAWYQKLFLKRFPDDPRALQVRISQADRQFGQEDYAAAFEHYDALLKTFPENPSLHKKRLICLVRMGKISAVIPALESLKKQLGMAKEDLAEIEYEIGNYYLKQKSFETAEKRFKRLVSRYKKTRFGPYGEYGLGKLKLITNRTDEALEILTGLMKRYPGHPVLPPAYLTLGDFYYKTKQFGNAIAAFNRILELSPSEKIELLARKYLVKIYSDVGQYESALIAVRRFLQVFPNDSDAFDYRIRLGIILFNLKEYDRAIAQLGSLLPQATNEQEAEIRYWIAKSYFNWGRFRKAIAEYLKVTYLTRPTKLPWHVTAEYDAGLAYMKLEEWDRAEEMFQKIVKKEGASSDFGRVALMKLQEVKQLRQN